MLGLLNTFHTFALQITTERIMIVASLLPALFIPRALFSERLNVKQKII